MNQVQVVANTVTVETPDLIDWWKRYTKIYMWCLNLLWDYIDFCLVLIYTVCMNECICNNCVFSDVFSGTARSSSLPSFPPGTDGFSVAAWRSLGAAVPLFLLNRSRPLLPPQREPTTQQLQGAARHLEGHHCYSPTTVNLVQYEGLHLPGPSSFTPPDSGWEHLVWRSVTPFRPHQVKIWPWLGW